MVGRKVIDLAGETFGRWTVLRRESNDKSGNIRWLCRCKCGKKGIVHGNGLREGTSQSCGCLRQELVGRRTTIEMTGQKYGLLTVLKRSGSTLRNRAAWLCQCDCGNKTVVNGMALRTNHTKSCGCLQITAVSLPHGQASFNRLFSQTKREAKYRKYEWQLTKEQFRILTSQPCFYCGTEPKQGGLRKDCNGLYLHNGLDRVDNKRGYTLDNVVACCKNCNIAKRAMTIEQFKTWVCNIYEHFGRTMANSTYA